MNSRVDVTKLASSEIVYTEMQLGLEGYFM